MKELLTSDIYQIRSSYMLDDISYKTLLQLYQPIMGMEAVSLYMTLYSELDQITLTKSPSLISRLCKMTGFSLNELSQSLSKLEAIGLMSSYKKKSQENRFLFDLKMPYLPHEFLNHPILNDLLQKRLKDEYKKTVSVFKVYNVNLDHYQDISANFTDVFDVHYQGKEVLKEKSYKQKIHKTFEDEYDLSLFYQGIENLQLSKKMFTKEEEQLIQRMGLLYKINALDMQNLVKQSVVQGHLGKRLFSRNCQQYYDLKMPEKFENIFHKQSPLLHEQTGKSSLDKHIYYLENISPYDLLKDKIGGKEPLKRDLQVIESLLTTLELEPGVINVLIETTLEKCNQSLPKSFMEALGSQWKRKKIQTVKEAIDEGKAYLKYQGKQNASWDEYTKEFNIVSHDQKQEEVDEDALALLQQYD